MFNFKILFILTFTIFSFQANIFGQQQINKKVNDHRSGIEHAAHYVPFEQVAVNRLNGQISKNTLDKKEVLQLQSKAVYTIRKNAAEHLRIALPLKGRNIELELIKANIFSDDFRLVAASNPDLALETDKGIHYWGIIKDLPGSLVVLSFFEQEIVGAISYDGQGYTIGKVKNSAYHVLYENDELSFYPDFSCEAIETPGLTVQPEPTEKSAAAVDCVHIHIEADHSLYLSNGASVSSTTTYSTALFAQVAIMFANENINIAISYLQVWDTPSPYTAGNELSDLNAQNYGQTFGNLVHVFHTNGGGGVAYVGVLCNTFVNTGVSGIYTTFNNVPTYSWSVNVLAHELGHNFGSLHTHDCVWNDNNTQIDDCGSKYYYDDGDPDTSPEPCYDNNNEILPVQGTIMSYCHLISNIGIDFNLGFGTQPGDVMRTNTNNANCLIECGSASCDDGFQNGDETGIDCGGTDCPVCPTCDDGIQNGEETDIDCGGGICPTCPCFSNTSTLTIVLDNYPSETTWNITDSTGAIIAVGGSYSNQPSGTIVTDIICMPDDCYSFTINDSYGDGICCGYGTGSYLLTYDADGSVLASGGEFLSTETTNFCVSDCPAILSLTTSVSTGTYSATTEINCNSTIDNAATLSFKAGQIVKLENGFKCPADANLEVGIGACQ